MDFNDTVLESGLERFCDLNSDIDCIGIESLRNELKGGIKIIKYFIIESGNLAYVINYGYHAW